MMLLYSDVFTKKMQYHLLMKQSNKKQIIKWLDLSNGWILLTFNEKGALGIIQILPSYKQSYQEVECESEDQAAGQAGGNSSQIISVHRKGSLDMHLHTQKKYS